MEPGIKQRIRRGHQRSVHFLTTPSLRVRRSRIARKRESSGKARRCYESPSRQLKNDPEKIFRASRGIQIGATRLYTLPLPVNILPYQSQIASAASVRGCPRRPTNSFAQLLRSTPVCRGVQTLHKLLYKQLCEEIYEVSGQLPHNWGNFDRGMALNLA